MSNSIHAAEPTDAWRRRFQAGEPAAAEELADAFFADVQRFCAALMAEPEAAMEAVQETFLRVLERHRQYDSARPFRPWLFAICRNVCLTLRREKASHGARVLDLTPDDEEVQQLAAEVPGASELLLREERARQVLEALTHLPEQKRTIVLLHLFEELTFREIAELTGRPANSVATTYYRTLIELRRMLLPSPSKEARHG